MGRGAKRYQINFTLAFFLYSSKRPDQDERGRESGWVGGGGRDRNKESTNLICREKQFGECVEYKSENQFFPL